MTVQFTIDVEDVEEDANIELIKQRIEYAVHLAMPYHTICVDMGGN